MASQVPKPSILIRPVAKQREIPQRAEPRRFDVVRPHGGAAAPPSGRRHRVRDVPGGDRPGCRAGASTHASLGREHSIHLHALGHIHHPALEPIGGHIGHGTSFTSGEAETEELRILCLASVAKPLARHFPERKRRGKPLGFIPRGS